MCVTFDFFTCIRMMRLKIAITDDCNVYLLAFKLSTLY